MAWGLVLLPAVAGAQAIFPRPLSLAPQVTFWTRVYTEFGNGDFVLHDRQRTGLIYEIVHVPEADDPARAAQRAAPTVELLRTKYQGLLTALAASQDPAELGPDALRVAEAWGCPCAADTLLQAAGNVRVQQGLRERVPDGLGRARRLMPQIVAILREHHLPVELAAIPMVESCFNPQAESKVVAVGLWQFMPTTGKQYLRISRRRNDRRDPIKATEGAAHLLRDNYDLLGSWPLAIVAYNHGAGGMQAARRSVGSAATEEIIARYTGPRFGFASKNF